MSTIDIIILLLFVPGIIQGIRKGFVSQLIGFVSVFLGIWFAAHFSNRICDMLIELLPTVPHKFLYIIVFIFVVCITIFILGIVGKALRKVIRFAMLGIMDRLLGVVFATCTTLIIISLVAMIFAYINNLTGLVCNETLAGSSLYQPVLNFADSIFPYFKWFIIKS